MFRGFRILELGRARFGGCWRGGLGHRRGVFAIFRRVLDWCEYKTKDFGFGFTGNVA